MGDEGPEIGKNLLRSFAIVDVVSPDMQDDHARMIRQNESIRVVNQVRQLKRIDAAVDDDMSGQIFVHRPPAKELGIACEKNGASRRSLGLVRHLVCADVFLKAIFRNRHWLGLRREEQKRRGKQMRNGDVTERAMAGIGGRIHERSGESVCAGVRSC